MLPFESVATATDSPRYSPAGSLRKLATEVNGMSGTPVIVAFCWATTVPAMSSMNAALAAPRNRFMRRIIRRSAAAAAVSGADGERRAHERQRRRLGDCRFRDGEHRGDAVQVSRIPTRAAPRGDPRAQCVGRRPGL